MAIAGRSYANVPVIVRGSLQDPPVLTTASAIVVAAQPAPVQLTVPPVTIGRSTLADPPVLTTAPPVVVAAPYDRRIGAAGQPIVIAAPQAQAAAPAAATPGPAVIAAPYPVPKTVQAIVLRSTLADPAVLTTAGPLLVAAPYDRRWFAPAVVMVARGSLKGAPPPPPSAGLLMAASIV